MTGSTTEGLSDGLTRSTDAPDFCDLAIGIPYESIEASNASEAGAVNILYGAASGLTAAGNEIWQQGSTGVRGVPQNEDRFGFALAAGDLNGDSYADLAIGVPGEGVDGQTSAGAVNIFYGSASGLTAAGDQIWHQGSAGVTGRAEFGDSFGSSLAAGDFNGDGNDDLAIGVPGEDLEYGDGNPLDDPQDVGAVNVLYGLARSLPI